MRILYDQAWQTYGKDPDLARRYVQLLKKIAHRTRTDIPLDIKQNICKLCDTILIPGTTSHTRIRQRREPHLATTCHNCGKVIRRPLRRKRK